MPDSAGFFKKKLKMPKTTKKKEPATGVKLEALSNLTGKYLLPYSVGQVFTIDTKRAQELIDNEDAKIVK